VNNSIDYNIEMPIFDINPFSSLIPIISSFLGLPYISSHNMYSNMSYNVPKNMLQIMSYNNSQISSSENFLFIIYE
jgi:hypothetical protein